MSSRPLDMLRSAHRGALAELDLLERSARALSCNGSPVGADLDRVSRFFDSELKVHFQHEEEVLFPYLARVVGREGPIAAMLDEHQSLWRAWDAFQEKVGQIKESSGSEDSKQVQAAQQIANHIAGFLRSHIQKEDNVLFPLAEEALDPGAMQEVVARIQMVETSA
ncbi:MAG: hemerythrin domain-containing protein [Chloroflexi bacterium]|nr:hemerythrin domain-containing protein [Chloroflexota bacterium]